MIKNKITGFNFSQVPTGVIKNDNAKVEEPEKVTGWIATGITYLLPNLGDKKQSRKYQPMTCV